MSANFADSSSRKVFCCSLGTDIRFFLVLVLQSCHGFWMACFFLLEYCISMLEMGVAFKDRSRFSMLDNDRGRY